MDRYQPYVEDYNSEVSEVVPLSARRTGANRKSNLAETATYQDVSDSGYSSHTTVTESSSSPEPKPATPPPAPTRKPSTKQADAAPIPRPSSKAFNRLSSGAVPRNIPGAKRRDGSPTTSTGGADECDCPDCGKQPKKPSPTSPSILTGAWPLHGQSPSYSQSSPYSQSPYSQSPHWPGYQYPMYPPGPPTDSALTDLSRTSGSSNGTSKRDRNSMPPPVRPQSTFGGSTTSAATSVGSPWAHGYGGSYFGTAPSPVPMPPVPSSTCPPGPYSSMYAPPPLNSSAPSPAFSPYAPPASSSYSYSYGSDPWGRSSTPGAESSTYSPSDYSSIAPPPLSSNRRNSMRAQANAAAASSYHDDYPHAALQQTPPPPATASSNHQARRSSRVSSGERPPSWAGSHLVDGANRSYSVPPEHSSYSEAPTRRRVSTPQPPMRRRESAASQKLPPSSLSRAMESCAIADDREPPVRSASSRAHHHHQEHSLARRDVGTVAHHGGSSSDSGSNSSRSSRGGSGGGSGMSEYTYGHAPSKDNGEFVSVTVPESPDSEAFTMRYPAGIPVKLQLNAYRYVQQRQREVHQQLQYGAMEHHPHNHHHQRAESRESAEYAHRHSGYGRA